MRIGIVGSEAAKFTPETQAQARVLIRQLIGVHQSPITVISGGCHLGGIDAWAMEEAHALGLDTVEYKPAVLHWEGGYKQRNLKIADDSDIVFCITVKALPATYTGMRFPYCYHCHTDAHVKSGGCWTVKEAIKKGKRGQILVVEEKPSNE